MENKIRPFDYSDFEVQFLDRPYIQMLQRPRVQFFKDCKRILDLACGPGFFLELLKEAGLDAVGVERNETIAEKVRQKGLKVIRSDVFQYLETTGERFDGIFCSHLLEHLSFDQISRLVELITVHLDPGGVLVLVMPNPGSIRLHLFGFWRDPEHLRFYNGNLIASVCQHYGLKAQYSNEEEEPNRMVTPRLKAISSSSSSATPCLSYPRRRVSSVLLRFLQVRLFRRNQRVRQEEMGYFTREFNQQVETFNQEMEKFSEALNKIWSRDDEVVLVFRK